MENITMENEVLLKLSHNEMTRREAYRTLYPSRHIPLRRRAHFVKIRIVIPEEKGVSRFLAFLLFFPVPLMFARLALKFVKTELNEEMPFKKSDLMSIISVRGIKIDVRAHSGEKIIIKTI
jgi:hypothetical protein